MDPNPYASPQSEESQDDSEGDSTIRISRTTSYPDLIRVYKVFVDGRERAVLWAGQSKIISVSSGHHDVVARIDWCSSPTLSCHVRSGSSVQLECGSNLRGLRIFLVLIYVLFQPTKYLTLIQTE